MWKNLFERFVTIVFWHYQNVIILECVETRNKKMLLIYLEDGTNRFSFFFLKNVAFPDIAAKFKEDSYEPQNFV